MHSIQQKALDIARQTGIDDPALLVTRPIGEKYLSVLRKIITKVGSDRVVVLDFAGVELMDGSFADEVFGTLGSERAQNKTDLPPVILTNLNEASFDNLRYTLESRTRREPRLRNLVFPVLDAEGKIELVGLCEKNIRNTFALLQKKKILTARDIQEHFKKQKLAINSASTRLKTMYDLGLALRSSQREAPGGQYMYYFIN
jgi:hypothetical protein